MVLPGNNFATVNNSANFTVKHFAGEVDYPVEGLLEANGEIISGDLMNLMKSTRSDFVRELFGQDALQTVTHPKERTAIMQAQVSSKPLRMPSMARRKANPPPKLAFDVLEEIHKKTEVPLVLHGGSGITDDDFQKAISLGIVKVNIATASFNKLTQRAEEYLQSEGKHNFFSLNEAMVQGTYENVKHHIEVFNC